MRDIFDSTIERFFLDTVDTEQVLLAEKEGWHAALWTSLDELGFALAMSPEEKGGAGATWSDLCGVARLTGSFSLPLPLCESIFANWLLGQGGLEPLSGPLTVAAKSDLKSTSGAVSGVLQDVPWGRFAGHIVAVMPEENLQRLVVFSSEQVKSLESSDNVAGEARDTLTFEDATPFLTAVLPVQLPANIVQLGGAMLRSAQIAGALHKAMTISHEYAAERVQFGRPIGSFQAIQHQLAQMAEHVAASVIAAEAAFARSADELDPLAISAAKICTSEAAGVGASIAHAVHGAIGFTHEHQLHLLTRRLWSWRSEFGSETYWAKQLGEAVCKKGASEFWPAVTAGYFDTFQTETSQ